MGSNGGDCVEMECSEITTRMKWLSGKRASQVESAPCLCNGKDPEADP